MIQNNMFQYAWSEASEGLILKKYADQFRCTHEIHIHIHTSRNAILV